MDMIQTLALCACCLAVGAVCMHAHNWAINQAVARERQRAEKREERLRSERDNHAKLLTSAQAHIAQMQVEQAEAAGYEDGYRACYKDLASDEVGAGMNNVICEGLRNGGAVAVRILNH